MRDPYETIAPYYDDLFVNSRDQAFKTLSDLNIPTRKVVDLGCGTGSYLQPFIQNGYDTLGIDLSESLIHTARTKSERTQARWIAGDMREIKNEKDVGLVICMGNSLSHLPSLTHFDDVIKCVETSLVPSGYFIVQIVNFLRIKHLRTWTLPVISTAKGNFKRVYQWNPITDSPEFSFSFEESTSSAVKHSSIPMLPLLPNLLEERVTCRGFELDQSSENWLGQKMTPQSPAGIWFFKKKL